MGAEFAARRDLMAEQHQAMAEPSALQVGRVDDPAEVRADRFAEVIQASMRSPWPATDMAAQSGRIRRSTTPATATRPPTASRVRRVATRDPLGGTAVDKSTAKAITSVSGGDPVPEPVRRSAEEASGHDLGGVRIHQGAAPAELSASLHATAFTVGSDIFLGGNAARPGTTAGNHLLAHELGHVVDEGGGSTVGRVRRLVSGAALREELGGPSSGSKTYSSLIKDLDSYSTVTKNPLTTTDNAGLLNEARTIDLMVSRIIETCTLFLSTHGKDKRAGRVGEIKAVATRERSALRERTNQLKSGAKPTWATWQEVIADSGTRDISAERAVKRGSDAGAMNEVTAFSFGPRIGERGRDTRARGGFFKADKANVDIVKSMGVEAEHAKDLGIPLGPNVIDTGMFERTEEPTAIERDRSGPRFANRSVAAYRIDKLLNANVIAKTEFAVVNTKDGPVHGQLMAKAKGKQVGVDKEDPGADVDDPVLQRLLSKLDLIDSLCGQVDRHGGNVFVDRDTDGRATSITGIDNDLAFGIQNFTPGLTSDATDRYAGIGKFIDAETGNAILKLTAKDLRAALDDLLLPDEIDAAIGRLVATQKIIKDAKKAKGDRRLIGPEGWGKNTVVQGNAKKLTKKPVGYHGNLIHGGE